MNLNYLGYLIQKPFHSRQHKFLKEESSTFAEEKNLYRQVLAEVAEYTQEDPSTIEGKNKFLRIQVAGKDYDALSEVQLSGFYQNTPHYLYELPLWNAQCGRTYYLSQLLMPYLRRNNYQTLLDFGAGAGDLCIALARLGFAICYTEVNKGLINFAQWRFQKRKLNIPIIEPEKLATERFDCVLSFDVFEHLKDLPERLKKITAFIQKGGSLIFNIELSGEDLHLKENKVYRDFKKLDKILSEAGLAFKWRFKKFFFYKKK